KSFPKISDAKLDTILEDDEDVNDDTEFIKIKNNNIQLKSIYSNSINDETNEINDIKSVKHINNKNNIDNNDDDIMSSNRGVDEVKMDVIDEIDDKKDNIDLNSQNTTLVNNLT